MLYTPIDVKFIFDSACLLASLVLQIFSKQQMSSIELSSCCSCYVFNQQFTYSLFSFMWPASMQIYWNKSFNSHKTGLGHKHGRPFIVLGHIWPP